MGIHIKKYTQKNIHKEIYTSRDIHMEGYIYKRTYTLEGHRRTYI